MRLPRGKERLRRALAALALIVACAVIPAVFALVVLEREGNHQLRLLASAFEEATRIQQLRTLSERRAHFGRTFFLTDDVTAYRKLQATRAAYDATASALMPTLTSAESRRLLAEVVRIHDAIEERVDTLARERQAGAPKELVSRVFEEELEPQREALDQELQRLEAAVTRDLARAVEDIEQRRRVTLVVLVVTVSGAALISALSGVLLFRLLRDLAASERRFRDTFNQAAVGIAHIGLDGTWLALNQRTCEILGYPRERLVGLRFEDITHPDDLSADRENLRRLRAGEIKTYSMDKRYLRPDGGIVWSTLTVSFAHGSHDEPAYFIAVLEDISARKRVEEERERLVGELRAAVRVREEFLTVASHELRTPLTPLALQLDSLRAALERENAPARLVEKVRGARRQARRLEGIVQNLLDVTELSGGELVLDRRAHDLVPLVREVAARFVPDAERARAPLRLALPDALEARVDRLRIEQLVSSLLSNAIRYGAGAPVDVVLEEDAGEIRLSVTDRGAGIPPELQETIFERFERAAPVEHYGGLGLGLFLARRIVEAHDGEIDVESRPGEGASFVVRLPAGRSPVSSSPSSSSS